MGRVGLVRTLKGVIIFLAVMAAVCYLVIFPQRVQEAGGMYDMEWIVTPGIAAVSLSAIPVAIALALFWRICTEIGRDNSFCRRNARWLSGIGFCALLDTGYCAVGTVTIELLVGSPIWILGMGVCMVGLAIALAAFLLSHLVLKAAELKDENDLTI
ncbi:MAG: DUF2975 domain-containing protein [Oscillospiraceae bacterium]|jgi:hypothetical protein|nr:DUF2975 domain-containing protein [Oscillospiraceae bacterium]MDE6936285.1 DUF2975 domain-containing protein [Oscillospiraceae bacterium]